MYICMEKKFGRIDFTIDSGCGKMQHLSRVIKIAKNKEANDVFRVQQQQQQWGRGGRQGGEQQQRHGDRPPAGRVGDEAPQEVGDDEGVTGVK